MNSVQGLGYHWLSDLFQRMGLPILHGMDEVRKLANVERHNKLQYSKTEAAKRKRVAWKSQHRSKEQEARKKWGKSQKIQHTYRNDDEPLVSMPTTSTQNRAGCC